MKINLIRQVSMFTKKILCVSVALLLALAAAGCSGGEAQENQTPQEPEQNQPTEQEEIVSAEVSGQVFEGEDFITCGILCVEQETKEEKFFLTDYAGRFDFDLEKGNYTLTFFKDSQYKAHTEELTIKNQLPQRFPEIRLERVFDLNEAGYYSADLHQHSIYSDGKNSPFDMYLFDQAMNMDFAALTDHNSVDGTAEFLKTGDVFKDTFSVAGVEVTSADKGHINVLNTDRTFDYAFETEDDVLAMLEEARSDTSFVQINHPARLDVMGFDYLEKLPEFDFDGYELWNGKAELPMSGTNLAAKEKWFEYLNEGYFIPATAGSDNHGYETQHSQTPRTYFRTDDPTLEGFLSALKSGHSFLSNGPVVLADIGGASYGEAVSAGTHTLKLNVLYNDAIGDIRVILNGKVYSETNAADSAFENESALELQAGDYIVIEVETPNGGYALTNPVFCK